MQNTELRKAIKKISELSVAVSNILSYINFVLTEEFVVFRNPEELFEQFDSTTMAFNPAIPPPRIKDPKNAKGTFIFSDDALKAECSSALRNPVKPSATGHIVDFWSSLCKRKLQDK